MISPYQLLGVSEQSDDSEIKQAYLQLVKNNPPERDQKRFQQIQLAYETLKDGDSRLRYALFHLPEADFDLLLDQAFKQGTAFKPLDPDDFLRLFNAVSVEKVLTNTLASRTS